MDTDSHRWGSDHGAGQVWFSSAIKRLAGRRQRHIQTASYEKHLLYCIARGFGGDAGGGMLVVRRQQSQDVADDADDGAAVDRSAEGEECGSDQGRGVSEPTGEAVGEQVVSRRRRRGFLALAKASATPEAY